MSSCPPSATHTHPWQATAWPPSKGPPPSTCLPVSSPHARMRARAAPAAGACPGPAAFRPRGWGCRPVNKNAPGPAPDFLAPSPHAPAGAARRRAAPRAHAPPEAPSLPRAVRRGGARRKPAPPPPPLPCPRVTRNPTSAPPSPLPFCKRSGGVPRRRRQGRAEVGMRADEARRPPRRGAGAGARRARRTRATSAGRELLKRPCMRDLAQGGFASPKAAARAGSTRPPACREAGATTTLLCAPRDFEELTYRPLGPPERLLGRNRSARRPQDRARDLGGPLRRLARCIEARWLS
jgi:hypothetical protein